MDAPKPSRQLSFGQTLRRFRRAAGLTQEALAERAGISARAVTTLERGASHVPRQATLAQLIEALGLTAENRAILEDAARQEKLGMLADSVPASKHVPVERPYLLTDALAAVPPPLHAGLVGRAELLRRLVRQFDSGITLLALSGLPGAGKTAIAAELLHQPEVRDTFADGALWTAFGPDIVSLAEHLSGWAGALGVSRLDMAAITTLDGWARALRAAIGARRMLLVLDDVWQIEQALALQVGGAHCAYLLTTRFPDVALQFAGEAASVVHELDEDHSALLLARLAPEAVRAEPAATRSLIQSVGGLPLALTLVGKYLKVESYSGQPRRIRAALERMRRLEERMRLAAPLATGGEPPKKTLTLEMAIETSIRRLTPTDAQALCCLSVFPPKPNSFSEAAALAVCSAPVETLDRLTDVGLLEGSGPGRYTLHHTISDCIRLRLQDDAASRRLISYYASYAEAHELDYAGQEIALANILAALGRAGDLGLRSERMRMALALAPFLEERGLHTIAQPWLQLAREDARMLDDNLSLARSLLHLGRIAEVYGDQRAESLYAEGLELARLSGDRQMVCALLTRRGGLIVNGGDCARAEPYLLEALDLAREHGNRRDMCRLLRCLGEVADTHGDYSLGTGRYREALALARQIGDDEAASTLLQNLGVASERRGMYKQAEIFYREGLDIARRIGYRERVAGMLMNLGVLAMRRRQYEQAEHLSLECLALARDLGDRSRIGSVAQNLGALAGLRGRFVEAEACLRESKHIALEIDNKWLVSETSCEWGELYLRQQQYEQARAAFNEALGIARGISGAELIAWAHYGLARVATAEGNAEEGRRLAEEGGRIWQAMGHERAREVAAWLALHTAVHV